VLEIMLLESINVGRVEAISHKNKTLETGICKIPVNQPAYLDDTGVRDDTIVDLEHHGGTDQAVYAYSADDYDWWANETGRDYPPGLFGENLTIRGLPSDMNVGDRLLIGEVVLEATAPRIPCKTFATRMQDSGFGLAFRKAERPGTYFRVLNSGEVSSGDTVTFVGDESGAVSILDLFRFYYALKHDADELRRFLEAPLAIRFRKKIESKLGSMATDLD
jgi:MOSC domain-containing protein YiiM